MVMPHLPLVSIAIPAYKSTYLRQAIDSVLAQTFSDWELVIVNDASPEPISEIVKEYRDSRIRYYENETNVGMEDPAVNWNRCLELAKGEFFCLLCDDDYYEPTFLEEMLALTDKYPDVSVFRSRIKIVDANNQTLDYCPSSPEWESSWDYLWHRICGFRRQGISEFLLRRKNIYVLNGYSSLPKAWFADEISICRFAQTGGIASISRPLSIFRRSSQNISGDNNRNIRQKVEACNIYVEWIKQFIMRENEEYMQIMLRKSIDRKHICVTEYLIEASWHDFIFLWTHQNTRKYHIYLTCFFKALGKRIINNGKRIFNGK